jgi:hypothetical protein
VKRTKEWWAALTEEERCWLVYAERNDKSYRSAYLPDDSSECGVCGMPQLGGGGMCISCLNRHHEIVTKANKALDTESEEIT